MHKRLILIIAAAVFSFTAAAAAASKPAVKPAAKPAATRPADNKAAPGQLLESDFARQLVDRLGFGEGLPENPVEQDYLQILGGSRTFKFEAEATFDRQSDPVSVRDYPLFGAFSGSGWVHGSTNRVAVHFKVFIPVSGNYTLTVTAKGADQLWSVAGKAFKLNSGEKFTERSLGQLFIPAGELEFNAVIPPAGAIDSFVFTAPAYAPVEPLAGWNPAKPLTAAAVNETIAALLGLESLLPVDPSYSVKVIEAAAMPKLPETVRTTDLQIFGKPVATKWVRAYQTGATLSVPLEIESSSVYSIRVRALGTAISAGFGQRKVTAESKPGAGLDWIDMGTFRLPRGVNNLELQLPPTGGVDIIEITKKLSSPAEYAAVTKSGVQGNAPLQPAELDAIITSLKDQFKERR